MNGESLDCNRSLDLLLTHGVETGDGTSIANVYFIISTFSIELFASDI